MGWMERTQPTPIQRIMKHMMAPKGRRFLNNEQRLAAFRLLMKSTSTGGRLKQGALDHIASLFSVSIPVIERIWSQSRRIGNVFHRKKNCGRKKLQIDHAQFLGIFRKSLESKQNIIA